jgi:hypothetical protein
MGVIVLSVCFCDGAMNVVDVRLSYASEKRSDSTIVVTGEIAVSSACQLFNLGVLCDVCGLSNEEAHGLFESTLMGKTFWAG